MFRYLAPLAALVACTLAQTTTDCNPLNTTCPDDAALGTTFLEVYNSSLSQLDPRYWNITAGTDLVSFDDESAVFAITKEGDSFTAKSQFYIFWGTVEIIMKAAPGTGIISTVILLSDDLDEVDWEIMGGNSSTVENNYYGWGNVSQINSEYPALDGAQSDYHNYTINWTQEQIQYMLNGNVVRTVPYAAPGLYPQTPCRVQFGMWCGGCSASEGTVQWAGGKTDFSQGPFEMHVKSIRITDGTTNATSYSYGDHSGSYSSIKVTEGQSQAYANIHHLSNAQKAEQRWNSLSQGAKIGIACGVLGGLAVAMVAFGFYCVSQRKKGREEAAIHEKEWEAQNAELMEYRTMMSKGNFAVSRESVMMDSGVPPKTYRGGRFSSRFSGKF